MKTNILMGLVLLGTIYANAGGLNNSSANRNVSVKSASSVKDNTLACPFGHSGSCTVTSQAACGSLTTTNTRAADKNGHAIGTH